MYVCLIYVYIGKHVYVNICAYMYIYINIHMSHICIYIYIYTCICAYTYLSTEIFIYMCVCTLIAVLSTASVANTFGCEARAHVKGLKRIAPIMILSSPKIRTFVNIWGHKVQKQQMQSLQTRHFPKKNPIALGADVDQAQSGITNILAHTGSLEPAASDCG